MAMLIVQRLGGGNQEPAPVVELGRDDDELSDNLSLGSLEDFPMDK